MRNKNFLFGKKYRGWLSYFYCSCYILFSLTIVYTDKALASDEFKRVPKTRVSKVKWEMGLRQVKKCAFLQFLPFFWPIMMILQSGEWRRSCETLKNNQICQKFGKKWRDEPCSTCLKLMPSCLNPFFGWLRVPENPILGSRPVTTKHPNCFVCCCFSPGIYYYFVCKYIFIVLYLCKH